MDANKKASKKTTKKNSAANKNEERKETQTPSIENKDSKTVKLIYNSQLTVKITYKKTDQDILTCGWLFQEAVQNVTTLSNQKNLEIDFTSFIALKTKQKNTQLDFWLTLPEKPLSQLPDTIILLPVHSTKSSVKSGNSQVSQNDFEILSVLAEGSTCDVFIARKKDSAKIYAIKRIGKKALSSFDKTSRVVRRELDALKKLNSNFVVKLHYTYQTNNYYFFVLDYLPGGDLFYYLLNQKKLDEAVAKYYVSELLVGLKEIHLRNIIYRDLKPENVLIDVDGHVCLADFGLAKEVDDLTSLQNSHCGTIEYMAPELAAKKPYNYMVDFYSLGVVTYEMLVGRTPFVCKSRDNGEFSQAIQKKDPSIPAKFSSELKDFLSQLLQKDPSKRLGSEAGAEQIMNHPWLADIDFSKLANKEISPPLNVNMSQLNLVLSSLDLDKKCEFDEENPSIGRGVRVLSRFSFSEDTVKMESIEREDIKETLLEPQAHGLQPESHKSQTYVSKNISIEAQQLDNSQHETILSETLKHIRRSINKDESTTLLDSISNHANQINEQFFETLKRRSRFGSCDMPFAVESQDSLILTSAPLM